MTEELPDPAVLTAIEDSFWTPDGQLPPEAEVVVRGSPITGGEVVDACHPSGPRVLAPG